MNRNAALSADSAVHVDKVVEVVAANRQLRQECVALRMESEMCRLRLERSRVMAALVRESIASQRCLSHSSV